MKKIDIIDLAEFEDMEETFKEDYPEKYEEVAAYYQAHKQEYFIRERYPEEFTINITLTISSRDNRYFSIPIPLENDKIQYLPANRPDALQINCIVGQRSANPQDENYLEWGEITEKISLFLKNKLILKVTLDEEQIAILKSIDSKCEIRFE